jgi:uncharacterized protein
MKIIVISDSHCERGMLLSLAEEVTARGDIDALIHLGDVESDAKWLHERLNKPVYSVPGNCDFNLHDPAERVITLDGVDMLLCHGHTLRVKYTLDPLAYRAEELGVKLALFGHTHLRCLRYEGHALLLNPGALANGFYTLLEIKNGDILMPQQLQL